MSQLRRFLRLRSGVWWTLPVVMVLMIMTMTQNALVRFDRTIENIREWEFGGHSEAVHFNTLVPTTEKNFDLNSVLDKFSPGLSATSCNELMSVLSSYAENQVYFAYKEFYGSCKPREWGFIKDSGRFPQSNYEVLVTADTGFAVGQEIIGLTPKPLQVVGTVSNNNSDNARVIIAYPGTFRSFGWPETSKNWPGFTAVVASTFDGYSQSELETYFKLKDPNVAFNYLSTPRKPLVDKAPYVYSWTALPLFLLAIIFAFALRNSYTKRRISLLNAQGSSTSKSSTILLLANAIHLGIAGIISIILGSLLAFGLAEPVRFMSSRELGPFPFPSDPLFKFGLALSIVSIGVLVSPFLSKLFRAVRGSLKRIKFTNRASTVIAVGFLLAAISALNAPLFQLSYFAFVLMITLGIAFVAHRFLKWLVPKRRTIDLAAELAKRRVVGNSFRAGLAFTGSILAIAPVLTFLLMFSSALAQSNASAVALPDVNQVTHDIYRPSQNDKVIENYAMEAAGKDAQVNYFFLVKRSDGTPVVASAEHLGAVLVVDSVEALEQMLQVKLDSEAASVLNAKGILWFSTEGTNSLWTLSMGEQPAQRIPFTASASQNVPLAWSNQAKAVVLTEALRDHNLEKDLPTLVVTGIAVQESQDLAQILLRAGLDPSLVRYHKEGDAYSETPLQLGISAMMGLLGLALLGSSMRSMIISLRSQTRELISVGVPSKWMTRVFLQEFRSTIGLGSLVGLGLTTLATGLAFAKFNLTPTVPWTILLSYVGVLLAAMTYLIWSGFRKIRA